MGRPALRKQFLVTKRTEGHTVITMHNNRIFLWGRHCTNHPLPWLQLPSPTLLVNFMCFTYHSLTMLFWFVCLLWVVSPTWREVQQKQGPCQAFCGCFLVSRTSACGHFGVSAVGTGHRSEVAGLVHSRGEVSVLSFHNHMHACWCPQLCS